MSAVGLSYGRATAGASHVETALRRNGDRPPANAQGVIAQTSRGFNEDLKSP
ncbi:MAG: hypothetical protein F6K00_10825 [Leptolyngbya sp. SIOISBB]|nr:hypothetical protein [Leptolyngbya sp. SIOISBB]